VYVGDGIAIRRRVREEVRVEEAGVAAGAMEVEVRVGGASPDVLAALEREWPRVTRPEPAHGGSNGAATNGVLTLRFAVEDEAEGARIADVLVKDGARLHALVPRHTTLEDLFVDVVETREV